MSLALKNVKSAWEPDASLANLRLRAQILAQIRRFFAERAVMEVETPVLGRFTITDRHIQSLAVPTPHDGDYYLQTSPEYAMKRLLAAGSGCIYQICKAFRAAENGQRHNTEFTILEWYRLGFDHHQLMDEVDELLQITLQTPMAQRITYRQLFLDFLKIDIEICADAELHNRIRTAGWMKESVAELDRDTCLQLLMNHAIEPHLGFTAPVFVYDFPGTQAALARLSHTVPPVAERFELYLGGLEIANGFHELTDPVEQEQRFLQDQESRRRHGETVPIIDPRFLAALQQGLPACAGVALGIDRLLMRAAQAQHIEEVIAFTWLRS
jgi:elongation factor P--(R)-beta-lysine ligase